MTTTTITTNTAQARRGKSRVCAACRAAGSVRALDEGENDVRLAESLAQHADDANGARAYSMFDNRPQFGGRIFTQGD